MTMPYHNKAQTVSPSLDLGTTYKSILETLKYKQKSNKAVQLTNMPV
jgi:hypothetical protein